MHAIEIDDGTGYVNIILASHWDMIPCSTLNTGVFELTVYDIKEKIHVFNVRLIKLSAVQVTLELLELFSGTGDAPRTKTIYITEA